MKRTLTFIALAVLMLLSLVMMSSCSQWANQYDVLDKEGATVSVKFDANGGMFAGTNGVTVVDVFDISTYGTNSNGKAEISLLQPDDEDNRGHNAFEISRTGHSLAGWFYETTETDANGQTVTVTKRWDFANDKLVLDPSVSYSSSDPVLTLKAVWIPYVSFEYYADNGNGFELIGTTESTYLDIPEWDLSTGRLDYNNFFEYDGKTFAAAYLDETLSTPITERVNGQFDYENGVSLTPVIKVYTEWLEGDWFKISNVSQLTKNASAKASYEILADLDFSKNAWPAAFINNVFSGTIVGNGHTISGVSTTAAITKGGDVNHGALFGGLSADASITDVNFTNITYTVKSAAKAASVNLGLFAGSNAGATLTGVTVTSSKLVIAQSFGEDFSAKISAGEFKLGVLFAEGECDIDLSGVTCEIATDSADSTASFEITVTSNGIIEFSYES